MRSCTVACDGIQGWCRRRVRPWVVSALYIPICAALLPSGSCRSEWSAAALRVSGWGTHNHTYLAIERGFKPRAAQLGGAHTRHSGDHTHQTCAFWHTLIRTLAFCCAAPLTPGVAPLRATGTLAYSTLQWLALQPQHASTWLTKP